MKSLIGRAFIVALLVTLPAFAQVEQEDQMVIRIGTSDTHDVTYKVAAAICSAVNKARQAGANVLCLPQGMEDGGSELNLRKLLNGDIGFAIVHSEVVRKTVVGEIGFLSQQGPDALRQVFTLFPLPFHLVVHPDSGITAFDQLHGRVLNIGPIGSGTQAALSDYVLARGWNFSEFPLVRMDGREDVAKSLCDKTIDAFFLASGIGSESVIKAIDTCQARIVALDDPVARRLVEERPYYFGMSMGGGVYREHPAPIQTFGSLAMLVTRSDVPAGLVADVIGAVFSEIGIVRAVHPALADLDPAEMADDEAILAHHPGAITAFRQAGIAVPDPVTPVP